jgi:ABC-type lipoprotein release transport system permease subunit
MKEYLKIAWRNLWRNKRRTVITSASILFAVFFAIIMRSLELGSYDHMIKNTIETFMGFLKIENKDYVDDLSLDNSFDYTPGFIEQLESLEGIKAVVPRIESFVLASTGNQTKGVLVIGIDPDREKKMSNPEKLLVRYRITDSALAALSEINMPELLRNKIKMLRNNSYTTAGRIQMDLKLTESEAIQFMPLITKFCAFGGKSMMREDDGVLVSDRLSKFLRINIGDTLILIGQGYHGASAAGLYPVRGIVIMPAPDLDNKLVFMTLNKAQELFGLNQKLTTISINPFNNSDKSLKMMKANINKQIHSNILVVQDWKDFNKILVQQIESDSENGQIVLALLYILIFFGIFGTVYMMIHERMREFGVLIAIGMQRSKLALVLIIEMLFMGLLGVVSGTALSIPILYIGNVHPYKFTGDMARLYESMGIEAVMPLAWIDYYVFWQALIVALMVVLSCIYPLRKVFRLKEFEALRA